MSAETTSVFPLVNPGKPSSLRRSHSVASESLPTPPSTIRKRPRTGSRSSVYSDDEDATAEDELPRPLSPEPSKKKRRIDEAGKAVASGGDETEEEEFWGPKRPAPKKRRAAAQGKRRSTTRSKSPPKVTDTASRRAAASTLLSPPPTRPRDPVTPPRRTFSKDKEAAKGKDKDIHPVRDSPNNPFLVALPADAAADSDAESDVEVPSSPLGPKTPLPELPTMTYVFRGKKQIFANPFYGAQPDPRATLSPRHPDYSPSEMCAPRRLFKPRSRSASSKLVPQSDKEKRAASPDPWDSEDEEGAGKPMPRLALVKEFAKARGEGAVARAHDSDDEAPVVEKRQASRSRSRSHHDEEEDDATVAAPTSDTVAPEAHSDGEDEPTPKAKKIARNGSSKASYRDGMVRSTSYVKKASSQSVSRSRSRSGEEWTAEV
ncbi:unnamed protein product [Peniophora sp. CBMAI 1063]|nr:unnamed protein product [Peniophora sp. CBMAI 1063]